jgi:TP901 family phage tail tape measure protein
LSTTTVDYTDASLIYYQQGLNDEEVQERTDATIKFANVSAQSAQTASEQLTAVWNNFDDGSESLEHYVDVMTALGATTASSSQEIAEGLEKFAAISDTVGLSYEYAASALATVTATTRQSADVVGTAFKTLFARVQDLELGETLDDGVTLGTYSQALEKVGVDVLDVNGNLIEMDDILDQLGEKWSQIGEAEKVSLAQTVAG